MHLNIGKTDRSIRIALGLTILSLGYFFGTYLGLIGLIPLTTAYLRWCPAYLPFRLSTARKGESK